MTGRRVSRRVSTVSNEIRAQKESNSDSKRDELSDLEDDEEVTPKKLVRRPQRERRLSEKAIENLALDFSAEIDDASPDNVLRKSTRKRKEKQLEGFVYNSPKASTSRDGKHKGEEASAMIDLEFDTEIVDVEKPEALFIDEMDVDGGQMYGFKTPKKRDGMALMASNTPKNQKTPKSQIKSGRNSVSNTPKTPGHRKSMASAQTPSHIRSKLKSKLSKLSIKDDSDDSDFSADESDYNPVSSTESSEIDSEHDTTQDSGEEEKECEPTKRKSTARSAAIENPVTPTAPRRRGRPRKDIQYVLDSDAYFSSHSVSKVVTSDHTLDRLKNPRLEHDKLFKLLEEMKIPLVHEKSIKEMHEDYKAQFSKWMFLMNEGFNIIVYGLGSKRNLLNTFHKKVLSDMPVIVINGFFPSLTIKDILDAIVIEILDLTSAPANQQETLDLIENEFRRISQTNLFLIVHNLDGVMLRNERSQSVLSRLASVTNIHLIASIDHINTPLIWDNTKLTNYNFSWWDCTTMLPYKDETAYENSMLVQNSGALALSSMRNVFQSLTTNGRGIYLTIVKSQLNNKGNPSYQGMAFKDLYWGCRESFLVSSDLALRAQLTEFLDHKLVKIKRSSDGAEYLNIPIELALLQQFLEQQESS